jgi:hypothetical protein
MKLRFPFKRTRSMRLLQASAVMTLLAIALMTWALVDPTPLPVMLAMTGGQMLGTTALALYVFVIVRDLRRGRISKAADAAATESAAAPAATRREGADSLAPPMGTAGTAGTADP